MRTWVVLTPIGDVLSYCPISQPFFPKSYIPKQKARIKVNPVYFGYEAIAYKGKFLPSQKRFVIHALQGSSSSVLHRDRPDESICHSSCRWHVYRTELPFLLQHACFPNIPSMYSNRDWIHSFLPATLNIFIPPGTKERRRCLSNPPLRPRRRRPCQTWAYIVRWSCNFEATSKYPALTKKVE